MDWFWSRFGRFNKQDVANLRFESSGDLALFNVRMSAYANARALAAARKELVAEEPVAIELRSKVSTQADLESNWAAFWLSQLKLPFAYHRKLWELAYLMQALHQAGCLLREKSGLGFGCGREVIPSYLASRGVRVLATDMPSPRATPWKDTGQYATTLADLHFVDLCSARQFYSYVASRDVDMTDLPEDLGQFDFCWSICAIEHLGTIEKAIEFVENALEYLKPGGVAVHTTEFAFLSRERPIEESSTVLFTRSDFELLQRRLTLAGHSLAPLDFDIGQGPMDLFIDGPPYWHGQSHLPENIHLKATYEGVPTTCFGLIIKKAG